MTKAGKFNNGIKNILEDCFFRSVTFKMYVYVQKKISHVILQKCTFFEKNQLEVLIAYYIAIERTTKTDNQ